MPLLNGRIRTHFNRLRIHIFSLGGCHVFGDIDHHWTWTSRGGDVKRLLYCHCQVVDVFDEEIVFDTRASDTNGIHFLKSIIPYQMCCHLGGEHHHGYRIHIGRRNTCHCVGHTWTGSDKHHSRLAGGAGKTVSRVSGTLLVPNEDMPYLVLLINRIIDMERRSAGVAKKKLDTLIFQTGQHNLCTG